MTINKISIISCAVVIIFIISIPTFYKVIKNHQNHLVQAVESKIISAAKKCYYEEKCTEENITLKELYDLKYLEESISNPISKEIYGDKSYVKREGDTFTFFEESD